MIRRIIFIALILIAVPAAVHAQTLANLTPANAHGIDAVLAALKGATGQWAGPLTAIAEDLFAGVAVIAFVMEVGFAFLQGMDGIQAILAVLLRQIIVLGSWFWVVQNWSGGMRFNLGILSSFQVAAQRAGGVDSSPGGIFELGIGFGSRLAHEITILGTAADPGRSFTLALGALGIVIVFALIAAVVMLTVGKAAVVSIIGSLAMGFGASSMTRHVAWNAVWQTVGSGARILAQLLVVSLGVQVLHTAFGDAGPMHEDDGFAVLGVGIMLLILAYGVPSAAEHLFGGSGHGNASLSHAVRSLTQVMSTMSSAGGGIARAGGSMMSALPGGGGTQSLPAPSGGGGTIGGSGSPSSASSGSSFAGSSGGGRMQPTGARFSRRP